MCVCVCLCVCVSVCVYFFFSPRWTSEHFLQEMRADSNTIFLLQPRSFPEEFWIQHERQDLSRVGIWHMWERLYWWPLIFLTKKVQDKSSIKKFQSGPFWLMMVSFLSFFLSFGNTEGKWILFYQLCFSAWLFPSCHCQVAEILAFWRPIK